MENTKKIKLFIGLSYLLIVCLFLYFFFSKFSFSEITSYDFLRDNQSYFFELKKSNLFLISIIFLVLTILWVFPFLGFGSPVALMGGFIFGKWIGTLIVVLGLSIGATFLYIFGKNVRSIQGTLHSWEFCPLEIRLAHLTTQNR